MAPVRNGRHLFNKPPTGYPEPGVTTIQDDSQTIDLENVPLNGSMLIKSLAFSIDPFQRGLMREAAANPKHYSAAYVPGEPIGNHGVGVVLRSENPKYKAGDYIYCSRLPYQEYNIPQDDSNIFPLDNKANLPLSTYVGAAGMPGQTAYYGWKEYSNAKKGEKVYVSTGAGAVGSLVIQLAKLDGLTVIASAGTDEKVEYMKSLGADVAFNYKTTSVREVLAKEGPIDIYWDHVGGETLQAALDNAARHMRVIACGMISGYNGQNQEGLRLWALITQEIKIYGFLVSSFHAKYKAEFFEVVPEMLAQGKLKFREDASHGLASIGQAFYDVQSGKNNGKKVIIL